MIIWVASYPKSGNTWMRALITSYLYSQNGNFNFDLLSNIPLFTQDKYFSPVVNLEEIKSNPLKIVEYWSLVQSRVNLNNKIKFFKTHNACAIIKKKWKFMNRRNLNRKNLNRKNLNRRNMIRGNMNRGTNFDVKKCKPHYRGVQNQKLTVAPARMTFFMKM